MRDDNLWNLEREWREINYLFHYLEKFKIIKNDNIKIFGDNEKLKNIENFTERLVKEINNENTGYLFNKLKISRQPSMRIDSKGAKEILLDLFYHNNIELETIKWIHRGNVELINYLWSFLTMAHVINNSDFLYLPKFYHLKNDDTKSNDPIPYFSLDKQLEKNILPYRKLKLEKTPTNTEEKYKNIIKFIDSWPVDINIKKQQMKIFENRWISMKNKNKMRQWLRRNSTLNDWSWDFIKSNFLNNKTPYWVSDIDNMDEKTRSEEIEITLITLYNLIESPEAKALMMANLSRAASQYRYREKSKEDAKSYINIVISSKNKSHFDSIKDILKKNSEDTLGYLIDLGIKETNKFNALKKDA